MLNIRYNLPKQLSHKGLLRYAKPILSYLKKILASNLAFVLIALPSGTATNYINESPTNLIIPEENLATSFNIPLEESSGIQMPVEFTYISQNYSSFHPGIDFPSKWGNPVKPIEPGVVEEANYSPFGYGYLIIIDNGNGRKSLYAHLSKIEVKKGDKVKLSTQIGKVGSTGQSTGSHLHLEVYENDKTINPLTILPTLEANSLLAQKP